MGAPSGRRRAGREAFHPGEDWKESCPYEVGSFEAEDFLDGWNEAAAQWEAEQEEKSEQLQRFNRLADGCPWRDTCGDGDCIASGQPCTETWCAIWHFLEGKDDQ